MVIRMRVARAKEFGLDYKPHAGIWASTGRDVIGFLFSSNALRMVKHQFPVETVRQVAAIQDAEMLALVHRPFSLEGVQNANPVLNAVDSAPLFDDSWTGIRDKLRGFIAQNRLPSDGVLVIGDTSLERGWSDVARAAVCLSADRYFEGLR